MESTNPNFQNRKREVDRMVDNWTALLNNMLEMVILIKDDHIIEFMNRSAISVFGDLTTKKCHEHLCNGDGRCQSNCPINQVISGNISTDAQETTIGKINVSYTAISFRGYLGDKLIMFVIRDITKRIQQEKEIFEFHENLEKILQEKIFELHETEKIRNKLSQQVNILQRRLQEKSFADDMVGSSKKMRDLKNMIDQVANSDATILITGESGTGKELVADLIQKCSNRNK